jgi:MinD-like ATPase involved in chromosome partitioning or flagellar assembly
MVAEHLPPPPPKNTEFICVASGKGGTGKTLILASLGYALQVSGHEVLFIDADTATDGLSLFLLGPRGWEAIADLSADQTLSGFLRQYALTDGKTSSLAPFTANRGTKDDHGQSYKLILSGRGLYGDRDEETGQSADPQLPRELFRRAIGDMFSIVRQQKLWDYVLIDTRGGFGFSTTDICALADSFFIVTEPDFTSFYQDKNLVVRITAAAAEMSRKPLLRGVIVNKATESAQEVESGFGVHSLNLDRVEASFRNVLVDELSIRYADTYPVPLDINAVNAYKSQRLPYLAYPSSVFSYATLVAFSGLMRVVTVRWPENAVVRWNALVDKVSHAIQIENEKNIDTLREQQSIRDMNLQLRSEASSLMVQLDALKRAAERNEHQEEARFERERLLEQSKARTRLYTIVSAVVGVTAMLVTFVYVVESNQRAAFEQTLATQKLLVELETVRAKTESVGSAAAKPPAPSAPPAPPPTAPAPSPAAPAARR